MKLKKLEINGYKNLGQNTVFNFENCTNYVALIGLNGSGKSNILEAVSKIIHGYHYKKAIISLAEGGFDFLLEYEKDGKTIRLQNNQLFVNNRLRKQSIEQFLPSQVIACYSGEELRLWEDIFAQPYLQYFNKIKLNYLAQKLRFLYINKFSWEIALLTLLCHSGSEDFIKNLLGIADLQDVNISFNFSDVYEHRKAKYSVADTTEFIVPQLTDRLKAEQEFYPATIVENENDQILPDEERLPKEFENQFLKLSEIKGIGLGNLQSDIQNIEWCRKLFDFLFLATMPIKKKLITKVKIEFNNKDVRKLSEGEKKLILIKCISSILADDNSIVLYDEPDVSLHISRKKEIKNLIETNSHFTMLTTHSPKLIKELEEKNVFIVNNNATGVEVLNTDIIRNIEHITDNEFSITDATLAIGSKKPLLLVEGKGDVDYINKAIDILNQKAEIDIDILPFGGAANASDFLKELSKSIPQNKEIIILFDRDDAGKDGMKSCINFSGGKANENTYRKNNYIFLMLPKIANHNDFDFLIEDYFSIAKKNNVATQFINNANGVFNKFPKDLKQKIKDELSKSVNLYVRQDLEGFQTLLDKLKRIINKQENFSLEEI
ncbi:AAA family ATPase [Pedobacter sp. KR3-3]|uniref:AAA family ATPase n=1 Tax=Pedobacter albus TaxID=3113905 RepID=A0ABU7IBT7_9SPHI|nr:AAA family ATPase [Pedobacter sp. KR3-3]MEE1946933.1 AAA family ATPase [Pedobacter sp. KR3-3]